MGELMPPSALFRCASTRRREKKWSLKYGFRALPRRKLQRPAKHNPVPGRRGRKDGPPAVGYAASDGAGCQGDCHAARKTDWREFRNLSDIEADHRYRLLVEAVQDYAIFMLDLSGNVTSWNPGAQRAKGYSAEEITGRHFSLFYTSEDVAVGKPLSPNVFSSCDWER